MLVQGDPKTFYQYTYLGDLDLTNQDLSNMDFMDADAVRSALLTVPEVSSVEQDRADITHQMAVAEQVFADHNERFTKLRAHIFELILQSDGAVRAYDLLDQIKRERGSPRPPTVYRALETLSKLGLIHRVEALNAYIACTHFGDGKAAAFFICQNCRRVDERHADAHLDRAPDGFTVKRSMIEHFGTCAKCEILASTESTRIK